MLGTHFTVVTDHKNLESLKTKSLTILSPRQVRWLIKISPFDFNILYTPRKKNILADALSRIHETSRDSISLDSTSSTMFYSSTSSSSKVNFSNYLEDLESWSENEEGFVNYFNTPSVQEILNTSYYENPSSSNDSMEDISPSSLPTSIPFLSSLESLPTTIDPSSLSYPPVHHDYEEDFSTFLRDPYCLSTAVEPTIEPVAPTPSTLTPASTPTTPPSNTNSYTSESPALSRWMSKIAETFKRHPVYKNHLHAPHSPYYTNEHGLLFWKDSTIDTYQIVILEVIDI